MNLHTFCCDKFEKKVRKQQFEFSEGDWGISGCCGGGCYVVKKMKFCPYCGAALLDGEKEKP